MIFFAQINDIKDIRPPVYFPADHSLLIAAACALIAAGLFILARYLLRRYRKPKADEPVKRPAHEIAYAALEELKGRGLPARGMIREYYLQLSNIVRRYIENRFNVRAAEMTTEEFLFTMKNSEILDSGQKDMVKIFLELSDMVKFAKYGPTPEETDNSFEIARHLVDATRRVVEGLAAN